MKIFVISLVCALAGGTAGSVQAWGAPLLYPGAVVRAEPQIKGFAYSSSQYINSVPSAAYSLGLQPQFAYQVPSFSGLAPVPSAYYPIASPSIYPTNIYLTTVPGFAPALPAAPTGAGAPPASQVPSQTNTSDDTTVIESADQTKSQSTAAPSQSGQSSPPASTFPNFPSIPQIPQLQESPQGSQSNIPQSTQESSDDEYSEGPGSAPPSFLAGIAGNKGFNDEDTVSVESA